MPGNEQDLRVLTAYRRRQWAKTAFWGSAVLILGILIGGMITYQWMTFPWLGMPSPPEISPEKILQYIRHDLRLTEEQANSILPIIKESHQKLESVRERVEPEISAEMDLVHEKIRSFLNPKQQARWDERYRTLKKRMHPHSQDTSGR